MSEQWTDPDLDRGGHLARQAQAKKCIRDYAYDLAIAGICSRLEARDLDYEVARELRNILEKVMRER